jgi:hypothetical protein
MDQRDALARIEAHALLMTNYVRSYRDGTVIQPKDPIQFMRTIRDILDRDIAGARHNK